MKRPKIFLFFILLVLLAQVNSAYGQEPWKENRSRHFIIYSKNAPQDLIQDIVDSAERFYEEITRNLGFSRFAARATGVVSVYIYADQDEYMASSQQEGWSQGVAEFRRRQIRTFPAAHGFFDTILPHELGHIIFRDFVGDNPSIPLWVDEGVAMFQERAKRWGAHRIVKKAVSDNMFIPLSELSQKRLTREMTREAVDLFYAESASAVYYLITDLGAQRFVNLCQRLQEGTDFNEALHKTYARFRSLDDLNRGWLSFLDRQ